MASNVKLHSMSCTDENCFTFILFDVHCQQGKELSTQPHYWTCLTEDCGTWATSPAFSKLLDLYPLPWASCSKSIDRENLSPSAGTEGHTESTTDDPSSISSLDSHEEDYDEDSDDENLFSPSSFLPRQMLGRRNGVCF